MKISETIDESPAPPPVCEDCGRDAVTVIDGKGWCVDCFQKCGSCCSGE